MSPFQRVFFKSCFISAGSRSVEKIIMEKDNPFLEKEIDLREYAGILYDRRWIVISCTVIISTLALIYSFMLKPVYEASTHILIEREAPKILNIEEVASSDFSAREYFQTQYRMLKSRAIAQRVDKELDGYVPWSEFKGRTPAKQELSGIERADSLLKRVNIKPIPNTQLVEIIVSDTDPKLAARISDLWAAAYIEYMLDIRFDATQYASGWLQEKITEAKDALEGSERRLQQYRQKHRIVETGSELGSLDILNELLKRKASIEIEISEKSEHFRGRHPEIIGLRSELASINRKIESEKEKEINSRDVAIQYSILMRDVETNKELYRSLLTRIRETEVTGELRTTNIRVVDKASVPSSPTRPRKKLNFLIALVVGIFGGSALAFMIEGLDQSIKTPEDVKDHLKLAALAVIPVPVEDDDKTVKPEFITTERPRSTISESYRGLRTSIIFTAVERKRKVLLVTSAGPREGKTTTAINLAIVMAQSGEKVLLLDADLRQPRIEEAFNFGIEHGMTEILAGAETFDSVVHKTHIDGLYMVACGTIPPNPSELLGSAKMRELLKDLETRFDRIVIDSPPVLAVTDAVVLSAMVDGTIITLKSGETNRHAAMKTKEIIEAMTASNIIGTVLTMAEINRIRGNYYYCRYYGKKYGNYPEKKA